jgi:SAM-dependent methyltransferase
LPVSPYEVPGFYEIALRDGRHRDIVGGRWDETGRLQMRLLEEAGLRAGDRVLDIGAGSLRLGCKLVPRLEAGHYWATDASRALMLRGREAELADPARLPEDRLVGDAEFAFPGVPEEIDLAIAFAVFTHLPLSYLETALGNLRERFPQLRAFLFTVFLAPDAEAARGPVRQPDGVVTHADRPPYHHLQEAVTALVLAAGLAPDWRADRLPRGQVLCIARP